MSNKFLDKEEAENKILARRPYRFYFARNKRYVALGTFSLIITNILDAMPPYFIGVAIDKIADGRPQSELIETVTILFCIILGLAFARFSWRIFWGKFHFSVAHDLRQRIYNKFSQLGPQFYQKSTIGELMSLISNDVNSFRMAIGPGNLILMDGIILLCIFPPLMYQLSPSLTWKTLIFTPLLPLLSRKVLKAIHSRYSKQQKKFAEMSGLTQEIIAGIRVIKSHAKERIFLKHFNVYSKNFELACNEVAQADSFFAPMMEVGVALGAIILLLFGANDVVQGTLTIGAFFTFYQYIQRMVWPASAIGMSMSMMQRGKASFGRILNLLEEPIDIPDSGSIDIKDFQKLQVKNLTFTYPGSTVPALKNISFTLNRGETLGLIGPTGCGKSTLLELLCHLYPVPENSIFINNIAIENIKLKSLRKLLSLVTQEAFLFSDTIENNIAFDHKTDSSEASEYARLVHLSEEIESLPDGYESMLGERGVNLSGGQKQRLSIARTLIRKSHVTLLDDSLSAVDTKTETKILNSLHGSIGGKGESLTNNSTNIISTHRLSSIKWADKILVLNQGQVEAFGTPENVKQESETYKIFENLQASAEVDA